MYVTVFIGEAAVGGSFVTVSAPTAIWKSEKNTFVFFCPLPSDQTEAKAVAAAAAAARVSPYWRLVMGVPAEGSWCPQHRAGPGRRTRAQRGWGWFIARSGSRCVPPGDRTWGRSVALREWGSLPQGHPGHRGAQPAVGRSEGAGAEGCPPARCAL